MGTRELRVAVAGAGFWAPYQIAAWREALPDVQFVAISNRTRAKAQEVAHRFSIPAIYDDAEEMLRREIFDVLDIITSPETHAPLTRAAAAKGVAVICQKPMAPTLADAETMLSACKSARVPLYIHENWRWQTPLRAVKRALDAGLVGPVFRARVSFISGFPVFANQPFLRTLEQFILTDIGTHVLDAARFLFGEARSLYCQTRKVHHDIAGEDVATVIMDVGDPPATVAVEMAYAENFLEREAFPQTFLFIEGHRGSIELIQDYSVHITTARGTDIQRHPPPRYAWAEPAYDLVQASMVPCIANIVSDLHGDGEAETTGDDNVKTLRLVFAAYQSAAKNQVIHLQEN